MVNTGGCLVCGGRLKHLVQTRVKCQKCRAEFLLQQVEPLKFKINKVCEICGKHFKSTQPQKKTCSVKCNKERTRKKARKS